MYLELLQKSAQAFALWNSSELHIFYETLDSMSAYFYSLLYSFSLLFLLLFFGKQNKEMVFNIYCVSSVKLFLVYIFIDKLQIFIINNKTIFINNQCSHYCCCNVDCRLI